MMDEKKELVTTSSIDTSGIDTEISALATQILDEKNPDKAKQLIALFNWNISKKNTARVLKLSNLYDTVTDQMVTRFKTRGDQFSNSDVLDYMKAVQGAIDLSSKNLTQIEEPPTIVQNNNTQINVNVGDSFDRDAKERILAAVRATLKTAEQVVDVTPSSVIDESNTE